MINQARLEKISYQGRTVGTRDVKLRTQQGRIKKSVSQIILVICPELWDGAAPGRGKQGREWQQQGRISKAVN